MRRSVVSVYYNICCLAFIGVGVVLVVKDEGLVGDEEGEVVHVEEGEGVVAHREQSIQLISLMQIWISTEK